MAFERGCHPVRDAPFSSAVEPGEESDSQSAMSDGFRLTERLPKTEILRKASDFRELLQRGKRSRGKQLQFFFMKAEKRQVGFVVPKRVGKAVLRNRTKRLMREVYRRYRREVGAYRIVVMARGNAGSLNSVEEEFLQFLRNKKLNV